MPCSPPKRESVLIPLPQSLAFPNLQGLQAGCCSRCYYPIVQLGKLRQGGWGTCPRPHGQSVAELGPEFGSLEWQAWALTIPLITPQSPCFHTGQGSFQGGQAVATALDANPGLVPPRGGSASTGGPYLHGIDDCLSSGTGQRAGHKSFLHPQRLLLPTNRPLDLG